MAKTDRERRERRREILKECLVTVKADMKRLRHEARVYRRALWKLDQEDELCEKSSDT